MKPKDKERLVRTRPAMVRSLDVNKIIKPLMEDDMFSKKDADAIFKDNRRREQVIRFLDILEKKKTEVYVKFQDVLGDYYPQLLLALTDWENDGVEDPMPSRAQLDDDWTLLQRARDYLIHEIDAAQVMKYMRDHDSLTAAEEQEILRGHEAKLRTEVLLDILETRPPNDFDTLIDACGETYPHVYLALTGDGNNDDDDDDW